MAGTSIISVIIGQGAVSGRPAAGSPGHLWFDNTVTPPVLYRDNGTTWEVYPLGDPTATLLAWLND